MERGKQLERTENLQKRQQDLQKYRKHSIISKMERLKRDLRVILKNKMTINM